MNTKRRVFLIVLDSFGIGEAKDAAAFGDSGAHTLLSLHRSGKLHIPTLCRLGLGNVDGLGFLGRTDTPQGAYARLRECSAGKDTTVGHWELAGHVSEAPLPTYPHGFPHELLDEITQQTGVVFLCNRPYSGTEVLRDFGEEHLRTAKPILYTSADSVFQVAAHTDVMSEEALHDLCARIRPLLCGKHGVGRVIARPFEGQAPHFVRTAGRRDFSLEPPRDLLPERLHARGFDVISVGKISDIFAARRFTAAYPTHSNDEGMAVTLSLAKQAFGGLCFVNLVDFDMKYGHRRDVAGYVEALNAFDRWLSELLPCLGREDLLMITADHGCDPAYTATTDHTREDVPLLLYGADLLPVDLGSRNGFYTVAATVCHALCPTDDFRREASLYEEVTP